MKIREPSPLQTGTLPNDLPTPGFQLNVRQNCPRTSEISRKVYSDLGKFAGNSIGPTRAMLDSWNRNLRQNIV